MEQIIDLLRRNGFDDDSKIEHKVFDLLSLNQIREFIDTFTEILNNQQLNSYISPFSFMPNSRMSSQNFFCAQWDCRLYRIDQLSRFAAFYADSVFIPNYFAYLSHLSEHSDQFQEISFRYQFAGDIKVLNKIKPLLNNSIIRLIQPLNPHITLCPTCAAAVSPQFRDIDERFNKNIKILSKEYLPYTKATLTLEQQFQDHNLYRIDVYGSEDLFEDGHVYIQFPENDLPRFLLRKIKNIPKNDLKKGIILSTENLEEFQIISEAFEKITRDLWTKHYLSKDSNIDIKYLTN